MENTSTEFTYYYSEFVKRRIDIPVEEQTPICPFTGGGECNMAYSDHCYGCETSKAEFGDLVNRVKEHEQRRPRGAKVFCIACGASNRSPLRKWKTNRKTGDAIYICSECWKIKERIGDEAFAKALTGPMKTDPDTEES